MYAVLGWVNIALLAIVTSHFWLRFLNRHLFHSKNKKFLNLLKRLRQIHKPLGIALVGSVFLHGFWALGTIRPHTGLAAATALAVTAGFGAIYFFSRKKPFFSLHRWFAFAVVCVVVVHLVFPSLFYTLFGI